MPEKSLWNAYCLVFLHPSPEFEPERFDQVNKEVLESLRNRGYNSRFKVLEDLRSLNNQGNGQIQNQMVQEPLDVTHLDNKLTRVESTLGRMSLIVSQVDTDAIPELQRKVEDLTNQNNDLMAKYTKVSSELAQMNQNFSKLK